MTISNSAEEYRPPLPGAPGDTPAPDLAATLADEQIVAYTQGTEFGWVASALQEQREIILTRWLDAVTRQPFHAGRADRAVADHIPALFDALVGLLNSTPSAWMDAQAPLENVGVL